MSDTPRGLKLACCGNHPERTDLSCYKIRRLDGTALTVAEVWAELTAAHAEIAELRASFDRQRDNYTQLYEAVIGDGTMVQCDPVAVAKELRAKCERLEHAGDALAEFLAPGPIPAESPTRVDYALGDWEFAKANPGGAHE